MQPKKFPQPRPISVSRKPKSKSQKSSAPKADAHEGRVVETVGRCVNVRNPAGDRICYLSGQRAVVGDLVKFVDAPGMGGKLSEVLPRQTELKRRDPRGKERILAANLKGIIIVATPQQPEFNAGLVARYLVAASVSGLEAAICLNKADLEASEEVRSELSLWKSLGFTVLETSTKSGLGLTALTDFLSSESAVGSPWSLVGLSGVGKTSIVSMLLPNQDVGPIGEISEHWDQGKHTTTHSTIFELPEGGELCDSPGIRTFTPAGLEPETIRDHFPGFTAVHCRFRDCLHREDEAGCVAEREVASSLLVSYRRLLDYVTQHERTY